MDISVHSFVRLCRLAEPLMTQGGACLTMSFYGAEKVVSTYNVMGPVKAALEAATREMASELGPEGHHGQRAVARTHGDAGGRRHRRLRRRCWRRPPRERR